MCALKTIKSTLSLVLESFRHYTVVSILIVLYMRFIYADMWNIFSAVLDHNTTAAERKVTPIHSILCPGLGTAVGCMPYDKATIQVSLGYFPTLSG